MAASELHITLEPFPILGRSLQELNAQPIELSEKELLRLGLDPADPDSYGPHIFQNEFSYGGYLEKRGFYRRSSHFVQRDIDRNIHLGIDLWAKEGTSVYSPLSGTVYSLHDNAGFADYGPTIILAHEMNDQSFFTLYGHLSRASLMALKPGQTVQAGEKVGELGDKDENGDWPPHAHIQLIRDMEDNKYDYPGVCAEKDLPWYSLNCPDPSLIIR